MGVLEPGGEPDLSLEALDVDAGAHLRRQDLDHYLSRQPGLLGQEDTAHPTAPELPQDAVGIPDGVLEAGLELDVWVRKADGAKLAVRR
jgi:hypothetical protein